MNDEDGFTMVDETFGVREASDPSDTDPDSPGSTSSLSPFDYITLLPPVQHQTHQPQNDERNDNCCSRNYSSSLVARSLVPDHLSGRENSGGDPKIKEGQDEGVRSGVLVGPSAMSSTAKSLRSAPANLNNAKMTSAVLNEDDDSSIATAVAEAVTVAAATEDRLSIAINCSARAGTVEWARFHERTQATTGVAPAAGGTTATTEYSPHTAAVPCTGRGMSQEPGEEMLEQASTSHSTTSETMDSCAASALDSEMNNVVCVLPASPGEMIREAAATTVPDHVNGRQVIPHARKNGKSKAVTIQVLPSHGVCTFTAVVPWSGKWSGVSVEDVEKELQLRLGLRRRVRVRDLQIEIGDRSDATGETRITVYPVDHVLVRARTCYSYTSSEGTTATACRVDAASSTDDLFVPLPLHSTLTEAVDLVREELGMTVPTTGCSVKLRRLSSSAVDTSDAVAVDLLDDGAPFCSFRSLRNGDTVMLTVLDSEAAGNPDAGRVDDTDSAGVGDSAAEVTTGTVVLGRTKRERRTCRLHPQVMPHSAPSLLSLPAPGNDQECQRIASTTKEETMLEAVDNLVALPACPPPSGDSTPFLRPPPPYQQSLFPSTKSAGIPAPAGGRLYAQSNDRTENQRRQALHAVQRTSTGWPLDRPSPRRCAASAINITTLSPSARAPTRRNLRHESTGSSSMRGIPIPAPAPAPVGLPYPTSMFGFGTSSPSPSFTAAQNQEPTPGSTSPADAAAIAELVGMGFDREHVVEALRVCGRGEAWKEAAISLLLEPRMSASEPAAVQDPEAELDRRKGAAAAASSSGYACGPSQSPVCPICLSDIQGGEAFTVNCNEQHVFCLDCLYEHCHVQLLDLGVIPACPLSNMTCGHELGEEEVQRLFLLRSSFAADDGGKSAGGEGFSVGRRVEREKRALEAFRNLLTRRGLEATGAVPCVSAECGNWMVPDHSGSRARCSCCLTEFCLRCKRSPYHYVAECQDLVRLAREWSTWLTEGKVAFLRALAAQNEKHQAILALHQQKRKEHDLAVEEAERVRMEYDMMEDWKERRCRVCPSCGRTIEKLSGCDLMICGVDAHGGNAQFGCGARFTWGAALPYIGDRGARKEVPFTEAEPQAAALSQHFIAPGIPIRCDRCHVDVIGPLFRCINCPSFACCLECQDAACRDPRHVHHTFQIVGKGEGDASPTSEWAQRSGGRKEPGGNDDGGGGGDGHGR